MTQSRQAEQPEEHEEIDPIHPSAEAAIDELIASTDAARRDDFALAKKFPRGEDMREDDRMRAAHQAELDAEERRKAESRAKFVRTPSDTERSSFETAQWTPDGKVGGASGAGDKEGDKEIERPENFLTNTEKGSAVEIVYRLLAAKMPEFEIEIRADAVSNDGESLPGNVAVYARPDKQAEASRIDRAVSFGSELYRAMDKSYTVEDASASVIRFCATYKFSHDIEQKLLKNILLKRRDYLLQVEKSNPVKPGRLSVDKAIASLEVEPLTDAQVESLIGQAIDQETQKQ
jgi:hypothetical protein